MFCNALFVHFEFGKIDFGPTATLSMTCLIFYVFLDFPTIGKTCQKWHRGPPGASKSFFDEHFEPGEIDFGPTATCFMTFLYSCWLWCLSVPFFLIDHRAEGLFAWGLGGSSQNLILPQEESWVPNRTGEQNMCAWKLQCGPAMVGLKSNNKKQFKESSSVLMSLSLSLSLPLSSSSSSSSSLLLFFYLICWPDWQQKQKTRTGKFCSDRAPWAIVLWRRSVARPRIGKHSKSEIIKTHQMCRKTHKHTNKLDSSNMECHFLIFWYRTHVNGAHDAYLNTLSPGNQMLHVEWTDRKYMEVTKVTRGAFKTLFNKPQPPL